MMSTREIPTLVETCIQNILLILEEMNHHPQAINDLCRSLSCCQHLLNPILQALIDKKVVTDVSLIAFLVPDRRCLDVAGVNHVKNSTLKLIGFHCPNMVWFDSSISFEAIISFRFL
jgi:hypothetical protein